MNGSSPAYFFQQKNIHIHTVSLMLLSVVPFQKFIETTRETSVSFIIGKFDGILGLGYPDISVGKASPIWYAFQLPTSLM
jgi:hypothetical protein